MWQRSCGVIAILCTILLALNASGEDSSVQDEHTGVAWDTTDLDDARSIAEEQDKHIFLLITGSGCLPCRLLEKHVLTSPCVGRAAADFVTVKSKDNVDVEDRFDVKEIPTLLILDARGEELARFLLPGGAQYQRLAIEEWLAHNGASSPLCSSAELNVQELERCPKGTHTSAAFNDDASGGWLAESNCLDDENTPVGPFQRWWEDGSQRERGEYDDRGKKTGTWRRWYPNGQLESEKRYLADAATGAWREWYENGQQKSEENYRDGELHGEASQWSEDGTLLQEGTWEHGDPTGTWTTWDEEGTLLSRCQQSRAGLKCDDVDSNGD